MLSFQSCVSEETVYEHMFGNRLFSSVGRCVCACISLSPLCHCLCMALK